jgi:hypothetical protein
MAETSSSPQAGGVGSSKGLAQNPSLRALMIPYGASSAPPNDTISKRRRNDREDRQSYRTVRASKFLNPLVPIYGSRSNELSGQRPEVSVHSSLADSPLDRRPAINLPLAFMCLYRRLRRKPGGNTLTFESVFLSGQFARSTQSPLVRK